MNERIRELADEIFSMEEFEYAEEFLDEEFIKKFTQLIVRECAGIYSKIDNGNLHMGTDDYLEAVMKHFGVKS